MDTDVRKNRKRIERLPWSNVSREGESQGKVTGGHRRAATVLMFFLRLGPCGIGLKCFLVNLWGREERGMREEHAVAGFQNLDAEEPGVGRPHG